MSENLINYGEIPIETQLEIKKILLNLNDCKRAEIILNKVSELLELNPEMVKSPSRIKRFALARHIVIYLIRTQTNHSFKRIGQLLGNRNHATIIHSIQVFGDLLKYDKHFKRVFEVIEKEVKIALEN